MEGDEAWMRRIGELKPNPSPKSHAELNRSTTLQRGDPREFGSLVGRLRKTLPTLKVYLLYSAYRLMKPISMGLPLQ